ncbi:helix-turn-helix domain-containing protein [Anaeromicrobium sediminis]|uniref:HTH cro/C1-type domain-containing protein n=1 Tax=Anaeromicrobium sediminis TaxID=1478221 RepID=A0A267MPH9_9FIRM|nr:helix-turn-helix transcriptional regulator [Anaeromicrobium sediminis]PAB61342.1 hypothetical protein CCE28_02615 [Anaeromicrobium sediminis]
MFGRRLKLLRESKELYQKDLAKIIGVSSGAIGMYENDKRTPDFETLKKIANYFNVSTDYLLGIVDDPSVIKVSGDNLPDELKEIGIQYLTLAKEMQDKEIPPEDIKKILDVLKKNK